MSIVTFGYGPSGGGGGNFESNAVRFSEMKDAQLKALAIEADIQIPAYSAKVETRQVEAGIAKKVLNGALVTQKIAGNLDDKC